MVVEAAVHLCTSQEVQAVIASPPGIGMLLMLCAAPTDASKRQRVVCRGVPVVFGVTTVSDFRTATDADRERNAGVLARFTLVLAEHGEIGRARRQLLAEILADERPAYLFVPETIVEQLTTAPVERVRSLLAK